MISFGRNTWNGEIADVSEDEEFQNALISIEDPNADKGTYDVASGKWAREGVDTTLYRGPARIKEIRWGVYQKGEPQANPADRKSVRVQVPHEAFPDRLPTGTKIFVIRSRENPELQSHMIRVNNTFQGSSPASRTYDCSIDFDTVVE